jgi:hypothetical protein
MRTTKKSKIQENALRSILRKEIAKIMEAEEEQAPEQEMPEPEQEDQGLDPKLEAITGSYVRKLKDSGVQVGSNELIEMISSIIESFMDSNERKLDVLKAIKSNIVH